MDAQDRSGAFCLRLTCTARGAGAGGRAGSGSRSPHRGPGHQPITREGLKDIFGKEISRDLIGRLHARDLIGTGPRAPQRGAPYTFVTTEQFLIAFNLESLRDLPNKEQLVDAGLSVENTEAG